jgi:hypothetical protein
LIRVVGFYLIKVADVEECALRSSIVSIADLFIRNDLDLNQGFFFGFLRNGLSGFYELDDIDAFSRL